MKEENFLKEEFITFVRVADNCTRRLTTQITLKKPLYMTGLGYKKNSDQEVF